MLLFLLIQSGELDKGGPVSECLLELLIDMTKADNNGSKVLVPRKLLDALRKKCPQFEGGDQHDAHELLRHLLDIVRTEDLRVSFMVFNNFMLNFDNFNFNNFMLIFNKLNNVGYSKSK